MILYLSAELRGASPSLYILNRRGMECVIDCGRYAASPLQLPELACPDFVDSTKGEVVPDGECR